MDLTESFGNIQARIQAASLRGGRFSSDVELMLVTKTIPPERIFQAYLGGHRLFGENKIQEVAGKWKDVRFQGLKPDFIGHLQTNKVRVCLDLCGRIHSVDRDALVVALDRELQKRGERREVFLQVNTSDETSKYGVPVADALDFAERVARLGTLKVTGLMTLAIFSNDEVRVRSCFRKLKQVFSEIRAGKIFGDDFRHLSMGMSSDYEIAVEEGATIVRIGTAIFGPRGTPDSFYWPEGPS